eukprot:g72360.t1
MERNKPSFLNKPLPVTDQRRNSPCPTRSGKSLGTRKIFRVTSPLTQSCWMPKFATPVHTVATVVLYLYWILAELSRVLSPYVHPWQEQSPGLSGFFAKQTALRLGKLSIQQGDRRYFDFFPLGTNAFRSVRFAPRRDASRNFWCALPVFTMYK